MRTTFRKIGSSDVAGVTAKLFWLLCKKMRNGCVAVGCSNVSKPSKNIGAHKYNDSEKKRGRLWEAFSADKTSKTCEMVSYRYIAFLGFR